MKVKRRVQINIDGEEQVFMQTVNPEPVEEFKDISGVCPVCRGPLLYGEGAVPDVGGEVSWTCQDCGATGKEIYREVFDHHEDVRLGDGRPVPPREA